MFCETSLLVKFLRIICKNVDNIVISFLTFVFLDVSVGDVL